MDNGDNLSDSNHKSDPNSPVAAMRDLAGLWVQSQPVISAYLSANVIDAHHAEDLVQEVAQVVAEKFSEFDRTRSFTSWAMGIARNRLLKYYRSHARDRIVLSETALSRLGEGLERIEHEAEDRREALRICLERIQGRRRQVLEMRYGESTAIPEIAGRFEMSATAVSVMLHRIRSVLHNCIGLQLASQGAKMTSDDSELDRLMSRYIDGVLNADDLARLEARLLTDDEFVDRFARWCLTHRQIADLLTESALHHLMDQFVQSSPGLPRHALSRLAAIGSRNRPKTGSDRADAAKTTGPVADLRHRPTARIYRWLGIAAAAASVVGIVAWFEYGRRAPTVTEPAPVDVARTEPETKPIVIATLTQLSDPVWAPGAQTLHHGQELTKGSQDALKSGMAKVTFDCGAEVVLEGPCDFWLQDAMIGFLASGKITANVPRRAFSFAILSPKVDFVDLGTSFGVNVGSNGRTELHVFQGEVLCSETNQPADEPGDVIHVTASKAMEFGTAGTEPNKIAVDEDQFSGLISLRRAVHSQPELLSPDHLALWLAADVAVTTDKEHRVVAWQDILYGDNHSAEDAIQESEESRPTVVADAFNGHPGIRFNGTSNYLLTTPLETTDDQTVLFVCQFSQSAYDKDREWGGQILNYDGPPNRYLSGTTEPGVLQIGEPLLAKEFKPTLLTGQVFAGFIGSATVEAGRVDAEQVGANVPVVVAYRYDYEHGKAGLSINGRSYGEARAFAPQGITSRKIIGRHAWKQLFFHGDLAEMLIYNKALTEKELTDTTAYLAGKYEIKLDPRPPVELEVAK